MKKGQQGVFQLDRYFPASYHWQQKQPGKNALPAIQMRVNRNIPIFGSLLAVEYFFTVRCRGEQFPRPCSYFVDVSLHADVNMMAMANIGYV